MRALYWLAAAAVLFGLWLLFAGAQPHELIAGAAASILAATAAEVVRGTEHPRFLPRLPWLVRGLRLPWQILQDSALLVGNLFTGREGRFVREPFDAGDADAHGVARRTLETVWRTLPPNSIVIGIDRRRNEILLHVLEGGE
jgi:hypothetical protein